MTRDDYDQRLAEQLADLLVAAYRRAADMSTGPTATPSLSSSPWLTVKGAAAHAKVSAKTLYAEVNAGRLRAARVGGRRDLRFRSEWVDDWLDKSAPK